MQAGSLVVSYVTSPETTWACLILLLAIHLKMNHSAVRAVRMNTFNRQRACICFSRLIDTGSAMAPDEVSKIERVFERSSIMRWNGQPTKRAKIGVDLNEIVTALGRSHHVTHSTLQHDSVCLLDLVKVFAEEDYILWYDSSRDLMLIASKHSAKPASQLKAWLHAMVAARILSLSPKDEQKDSTIVLRIVISFLETFQRKWEDMLQGLAAIGWDIKTANLETVSGTRIELNAGTPRA